MKKRVVHKAYWRWQENTWYVACGTHSGITITFSDFWEEVNCKNCLFKHKRPSPAKAGVKR